MGALKHVWVYSNEVALKGGATRAGVLGTGCSPLVNVTVA